MKSWENFIKFRSYNNRRWGCKSRRSCNVYNSHQFYRHYENLSQCYIDVIQLLTVVGDTKGDVHATSIIISGTDAINEKLSQRYIEVIKQGDVQATSIVLPTLSWNVESTLYWGHSTTVIGETKGDVHATSIVISCTDAMNETLGQRYIEVIPVVEEKKGDVYASIVISCTDVINEKSNRRYIEVIQQPSLGRQ